MHAKMSIPKNSILDVIFDDVGGILTVESPCEPATISISNEVFPRAQTLGIFGLGNFLCFFCNFIEQFFNNGVHCLDTVVKVVP